MAFLDKKVISGDAPTYAEMCAAGVIKYFEERTLAATPIGNGTLLSALVKGGAGFAAKSFGGGGSLANAAALAFSVDAIEDALTALFTGNVIGNLGWGGNSTGGDW